MASSYDYFLTGDHALAKDAVARALASEGFRVETNAAGGFNAKRGSMAATVWLGAWGGKKRFHVSFLVQFFVDAHGQLVARLNRDMASGMLKGGAVGANMTRNAFIDTAAALTVQLQASGIYAGELANN